METQHNNPMICDYETGVCEIPVLQSADAEVIPVKQSKEKIKIIYFTDPICSTCWGIEPQLRKMKLEYGAFIEIQYRMGGLLKDWSYNSGGISKPGDVAHHWDEVSRYYDMPIDGDIWLEDPLHSSYPPSVAFKAAQLQDEVKAIKFLRRIREMVFLEKKNITKWEHLSIAANETGLDIVKFKSDFEGEAKEFFMEDLKLAAQLNVRGFPTLFFQSNDNSPVQVYGFKPYKIFEDAIIKVDPTVQKKSYDKSWENIFHIYPRLTTKEFSELSGMPRNETQSLLQELINDGRLQAVTTKNGTLWKKEK